MGDVNTMFFVFVWECKCTGHENGLTSGDWSNNQGDSCASIYDGKAFCYVDGTNADCTANYDLQNGYSGFKFSYKICGNPYIVFFCIFSQYFFFFYKRDVQD